ncbi:MAG: T9SS type A sorting domain-containing protein [Rhodothermales bacterium]
MPSFRPALLLLAALVFLPQTALAQRLANAVGSTDVGPYVDADHGPRALSSRAGGLALTHSVSDTLVARTAINCNVESSGLTAENSYWRVFDLGAFGLTEPFTVTSIDIGIELVDLKSSALATDLRLHALDGDFTRANLTRVEETEFDVRERNALSVVTVDITGAFAVGEVLVVEWNVPDLRDDGGAVFYGANSAGQTGPTYLSAAACGLPEPTDLADVGAGFPGVAWVLAVNGTTMTTDAEGIAVAQRVTLGQAYPNPVAGRTAIPFSLDAPQRVRIAVYDALGREVAVAADRTFGAGEQAVDVSVAGLPSGLYFYRLRAGTQTLTRKLVVVQ